MSVENIFSEQIERIDGIWMNSVKSCQSNFSREDHSGYLEDLKRIGAGNAVKKHFPEYYDSIFSTKRAAVLAILDPRPGEVIVDAGCACGALTIPLARAGCNVISIDQTLKPLLLLKQRLIDNRLNNVDIVCADTGNLIYKDDCLDKVIVNGILELVCEKPCIIQAAFLANIYKGLKRGGKLCIAVKNRFDIFNLSGWLYGNRIYSPDALAKMLSGAGFNKIETYYVFPDHRFPEYILTKAGMKYYKPTRYKNIKNYFNKIICFMIEEVLFKRLKLGIFSPSLILMGTK